MDERDIVLNSVLEELKNKKLITELEEDIKQFLLTKSVFI